MSLSDIYTNKNQLIKIHWQRRNLFYRTTHTPPVGLAPDHRAATQEKTLLLGSEPQAERVSACNG